MVSLGAVEQAIHRVLDDEDAQLVAINLPDEKKGEKVVLLLNAAIEPAQLREQLVAGGIAPLMLPAEIHPVTEVPLLGSGKTNFPAAREMALQLSGTA